MRIKDVVIVLYIMFIFLFSSVLTVSVSSQDDSIPFWNIEWSYRQEIQLPITTNDSHAKYQPIDIRLNFD
ncbi:MAG: hypothetical protein KAJ44_04385, partial [Thermoplasmatales archaeon]|nr:hypothetical protein [Thermoplasmatales archaeon]